MAERYVAVVAIYGIAWLAGTYFAWTIAIAFFLVSVLINSRCCCCGNAAIGL